MSRNSIIYHTRNNIYANGNDIPIRSALRNVGVDNRKIGWNSKDVTHDGVPVLTPTRNDNGTTYTNSPDFFGAYKKISGQSLVDVTQAASSNGLSNAVEYGDGGNVFVGGVPVENAIIINGQAYAPASSVSSAINQIGGYNRPMDIYNHYYDKTSDRRDNLTKKIEKYKSFSYNPESDPSYQAYKNMYFRNGERAAEDIRGKMLSATDGYSNSAAMAAGAEAYYNYISGLKDVIPSLEKNAYDRYKFDYDRLMKELELYGTPKNMYDYSQSAANSQRKEMNDAYKADFDRSNNIRDFNYKAQTDNIKSEREGNLNDAKINEIYNKIKNSNALLPLELEQLREKLRGMQIENDDSISLRELNHQKAKLANELIRAQTYKAYK